MNADLPALTADEVLTTTRSVRRRLDLQRPVDDALVRECVEVAMQAPAGSNVVTVRFLVVRDPDTRRAMGDSFMSNPSGRDPVEP